MNLSIRPFESVIAEALTGLIISGGQGGDAKKILPRAQTALAVATALAQVNQGNAAAGMALLQQAMTGSNMDPAVASALQTGLAIALQNVSLLANLSTAIPMLGATQEAIASNVIAGIQAAAEAEVAKYGAQSSAPAA